MKAVVRIAKKTGVGVLDFLLPPRCPACGTRILTDGHLCGACWAALVPIAPPLCQRCGLPFETDALDGAECGACLRQAPDYDWARAAVLYEDLARSLVLKIKHGGVGNGVPALSRMMAQAVRAMPRADVIVPVPLHPRRLFLRRFNQSQLLGKALENQLGVPLDCFSLVKARATPSQGSFGRKGRLRNVAGAFRVTPDGQRQLAGKSVLLVDDVLTTGATASACAKALKKAGVKNVGLVVFARVRLPGMA